MRLLPTEKRWYQHLLAASILIGIFAGVFVLVYSGLTGEISGYLFKADSYQFATGSVWWIPLVAVGGLVVTLMRKLWKIPEEVPGSIALANRAWVDVKTAPYLVIIAITSMSLGASLGPSFGLIVGGGAMGSWLVTRLHDDTVEEARAEYTLTGMSGALGAAFSGPMFAAILATELSPTSKKNYVTAFVPELIAAIIGFVIYFTVTGTSLLGAFELPAYEYKTAHILYGLLFGFFGALIAIVFVVLKKLISKVGLLIKNPLVKGVVGGALVGVIAFLFPLTASAGTSELSYATDRFTSISFGLLLGILLAKIIAIAISFEAGFLGGIVFPVIFLGGIAGLAVHVAFPSIPVALAVAAMIAAVPGALLNAPIGMVLIGASTVSVGIPALAPIALSVVVARILVSIVVHRIEKEQDNRL